MELPWRTQVLDAHFTTEHYTPSKRQGTPVNVPSTALTQSHLYKTEAPWLVVVPQPLSGREVAHYLDSRPQIAVRVLDGIRMRTVLGLFDEFASCLGFPAYFGHNWDALDECLSDLEWLPGAAYAIVVDRASWLLEDEPPKQLSVFVSAIERAGSEWSEPVDRGESWDRPSVPFHLLLLDTQKLHGDVRSRMQAAGAQIADLRFDDA